MFDKVIFLIISVLFPTIISCSDNTIDVKPPKDPRTYSWKADTISFPGFFQTIVYDMWGSSPKDVYAVGHASDNDGVMWHFDGNTWKDVVLSKLKGGQIEGTIDLRSVYGFSATDIYAVGSRIIGYNPNPPPTFESSQLIIHYDGTAWREISVINGGSLRDIQGSSSNNIMAGGRYNTLYSYNGSSWEKDSVNIKVPSGESFQIESVNPGTSISYLIGFRSFEDMSDLMYYFFEKTNNGWTKKDSSSFGKFGDELFRTNSGTLYSAGEGGVYKYQNSIWVNTLSNIHSYIYGIWGSNDDNIFAVGNRGAVYHYNGNNWQRIEELNDSQIDYWAVWTDGTEAFVAGSIFADGVQKTIVWHGK